MTKLKLGPLPDDKPVKVTVELPAPLNRDLIAALHSELHGTPIDAATLAPLMLETFIARNKGFRTARSRRANK